MHNRLLTVPKAEDIASPLKGHPSLSDQKQQNALQGLAFEIGSEGLYDLVGHT